MEYVSDSYAMLARAYAYREQRGRAFVIYDDETPVGMGMYPDRPDLDAFDLSQIFIDEQYQGKGYGKAATKLVLDEMKKDGKYRKVVLCYIEGNDATKKLYETSGTHSPPSHCKMGWISRRYRECSDTTPQDSPSTPTPMSPP